MSLKGKLKVTNKTIKTDMGKERVYKGPRGGKYIARGNTIISLKTKKSRYIG